MAVRVRPDLDDLPAYRPGRPAAHAAGPVAPVFACASNENPFPPLPGVVEAIAAAAGGINRYPDMACAELSLALASHLDVPADDLVLGPGSVGVLQQLASAVVGPGDEVVYAWRSFEAYPIVTRVAGATPVPVPLTPDGRHDVDAMVAAVTDRTRLLLLCSPNNPTGPVLTATELDRLLAGVPDDLMVVIDEAYVEMVRDPDAADGLAAYRRHDNVVVLRTFSKAYGLAGLRVGYAVARAPVAAALRRTGIPFGVSTLAQVAAITSLQRHHELLTRVDDLITDRERVVAGLRSQGWRLPVTQGNFVWFGLGERSADFAALLTQSGLSVRTFPGEGVRVTVGDPASGDVLLVAVDRWSGSREAI